MNKNQTTAKILAEKFEVSIRTIYRDIDILSYAGIPIYTNKGKGGGIFLDEQFILDKSILSDEEQNKILMSLQSNTLFDSENNSLIDKLSNIFQSSNINWIEVDYSRWANGEKDRELFNFLKESILNKNIILIEYLSSYGEKTKREIFPMKLIYKSKAWYLQAFDKNKKDFRSFRLSRIINYNNQEEKFERADYLPLPEFDNYDSLKVNTIHIKLKFSKAIGFRVYDEFDSKSISQDEEDNLIVEADIPYDYWIYSYLLSFGVYAEVIEPNFLKENLLKELEKIRKNYNMT